MYVMYKLKNTTYPNITSPQKYMHEGKWLKGCICIANSLDKEHIHEVKHINMKTCIKWEYKSNT